MKAEKTEKKTISQKSNSWFAFGCIVPYVAVASVTESGVADIGTQGVRLITLCPLLAILLFAAQKHGGLAQYGFASMKGLPWKKLLYCLPLAIIATANIWQGAAQRLSLRESVFYIIGMICVGILEELIFRGFLLTAILPDGVRSAVLICGITFGLGHIVNLLNGAALIATLLQLCYAITIGLMLSVFAVRTGNIVPCCIFHAVFNLLGVVSVPSSEETLPMVIITVVIVASTLAYAAYLWWCVPPLDEGSKA